VHPETHGRDIHLKIADGALTLHTDRGAQALGPTTPERLELSSVGGSARVELMEVRDARGTVLLSVDHRADGVGRRVLTRGTILGGLTAAALWAVIGPLGWPRGGVVGAMLTLPPAAVLAAPPGDWLPLLERLYLADWTPSALASHVLVLSLIPLALGLCVRLCALTWSRISAPTRPVAWVWSASVVLAIGLHLEATIWPVVALLWAVIPLWIAVKARALARAVLALDLVALGLVASLGLGLGLMVGTLWRIALIIGLAGPLSERSARRAMDALFTLVLAGVPATESALQHSALNTAWDPTQLSEERPSERGWRDPAESWSGRCGSEDAAEVRTLLVAGGSSTGGAYQFKDDPEASFVAQAHTALCAQLPPGVALQTHNYGRGNRDTFTISRTLSTMVERTDADVVVLYVGVNDLLGDHHSMSRSQREQARAERHAALQGAAGLARRLRLVTGLWLASRELPDADAPAVPDVPLADAEDNFERMAAVLAPRGGTLMLMTEHLRASQVARLDAYRAVQAAVAARHDGVRAVDVRGAFADATDDQMLVDMNHLTRSGGVRLGRVVADAVRPVLFDQASSR
jgi:hypothetical protein